MGDDISEAARQMGRRKTEKKTEAARENLKKANDRLDDPAVKADVRKRQSAALTAYWKARKEREAKEAGSDTPTD